MKPEPFSDEELLVLFADLKQFRRILVAVSGGPDSMALMHLLARWSAIEGISVLEVHVASVDHGLRPEASGEAEMVAGIAKSLGFGHTTLRWSGPYPETGRQEAARKARYRLLAEFAHRQVFDAVVVAHHLDDQAETVLMRLARGGGVDGLAAMAERTEIEGVALLRPLLEQPKARLAAALQAADIKWCHDPTNDDLAYERTRIRRAMPALAEIGLTAAQLARTAARLRRAREALELQTDAILQACPQIGRDLNGAGFARLPRTAFKTAPAEIRIRLLARLLAVVTGRAVPRLTKLEALADTLDQVHEGAWTLGGGLITVDAREIVLIRESGRSGLPEITLEPGQVAIWDRRFDVQLDESAGGAVEVGPLGGAGFKAVCDQLGVRPQVPRSAAIVLPCFRCGDEIVAVPQLDFPAIPTSKPGAEDETIGLYKSRFANTNCLISIAGVSGKSAVKCAG